MSTTLQILVHHAVLGSPSHPTNSIFLLRSISTDNCLIHNVKLQAIVGLTCHLSTDLALLILGLYLLSISHSIHSTATRPLIAGIAFVVLLGCTTIVVNILRGTMVLRYSGALDTRSHIVLGSEDAWKGADWLTLTSMAGLGIGCMVVALPTMRTGWREWRVRRGHSARKDDGEQQDRFGWSSPAYDHQMQKHHNQIQLRQLQQQQQQQQHQDQRQQEEQRKLWPWPLIGAWSKTRSSTSVALNTAIPQIGVLADVKECGCGKAEWEACEWGAADEEDDDQAESDGSHISPTTTTDGRAWARRESDDDNIEEEERRIHSGVITGSGHERTHSRKGSDRDRWSYNERWSKRWSWKDLDTADVR